MITYQVAENIFDAGQVIATTLKQGQRLVKAGVNAHTSDMHWHVKVCDDNHRSIPRKDQYAFLQTDCRVDCTGEKITDFVPAWSIGRLVKVAGPEAVAEGVEAGIDLSTPEALRTYLVGYILIAADEGLLNDTISND